MYRTQSCRTLICAVALFACARSEPAREVAEVGGRESAKSAPLTVFVVNYPLQYFAERIGGDRVEVAFPAPADVDPAYWSPIPETVSAYQRADLILLNGAGYAGWIERATLPPSKLVDTSAAFRDRLSPLEERVAHTHGPEGEHSHRGTAFTTWLDPTLAVEQARSIADAFSRARPTQSEAFRAGLEALEADLRDLDEELAAATAPFGWEPLLFSHPVYHYLAHRYGLNSRSLHWEPDQVPDRNMWSELEKLLASHRAHWLIWEGEPVEETATRLDAAGVRSLVYETCANVPRDGDFFTAMHRNVAALESAAHG